MHLHFETALNAEGDYTTHVGNRADPYGIKGAAPSYPPPASRCANTGQASPYLWTTCPLGVTTGTLITNGTLDGEPFAGPVNFNITGPFVIHLGESVPREDLNQTPGNYTISSIQGGPGQLVSVLSAVSQDLPGGEIHIFTLIFQTVKDPTAPLDPTLFFDGAGGLGLTNANFLEPAIDSQGNLLVRSGHGSTTCGFGYCGMKLHSIAPTGQPNWSYPDLTTNPNDYIDTDVAANKGIVVGPNDRAYILGRHTLYAYDSNGSVASGWPVTIDPGFNWFFPQENGVIVDDGDGAVYAKVGEISSPFPSAITALNPDGTQRWRTDYPAPTAVLELSRGPLETYTQSLLVLVSLLWIIAAETSFATPLQPYSTVLSLLA